MLATDNHTLKKELQTRLRNLLKIGAIQVNIMTKLDRMNYSAKGEELPEEYSDALAALRGYAKSTLHSAIVFSAGINRRLYSYVEKFDDFYADTSGYIKKKIILKVSDYRSAIIQGKFFAKKGIWVSEFRIESGLNCGGHAFASEGYLLGPILEEFKRKKDELVDALHSIYTSALKNKNRPIFNDPLPVDITVQGGVGTALEHNFLLNYYNVQSVGWGSPFLLVPQATNVDIPTLMKLSKAKEEDLYLSEISPLGVPFNNLRDNFSDLEKERRAQNNKPGSPCPKGHLVSNTEFTEKPICTASRQYQKLKVEQLEGQNLPRDEFNRAFEKVITKACICNDLGEAVLIKNHIDEGRKKRFSAICPGPNIAYFSKIASLQEMIGHIYGRLNLLNNQYRPNMMIKELHLYIEYFKKEVKGCYEDLTEKNKEYVNRFYTNMLDGIDY
ncbi:MAG: hypothetical protein KC713_06815, partial [Candidatus Omnitrophica bacterium]|nr:hypothetical protein [Candidatus Omnitrophota bacterium]